VATWGCLAAKRKVATHLRGSDHCAGCGRRDLSKVRAPVGLDIGSQSVPEIAISIVAELIAYPKPRRRWPGPAEDGPMTFAVVPAAGRSSRMGRSKLALPLGDSTVLQVVVETLRNGGADPVGRHRLRTAPN